MQKPVITKKEPIAISLEPGTYYWCACGKSKNQPFCDGSHQGSGIVPVPFEIAEKSEVWLCQCKHSPGQPYCDGTHRTL